MQRLIVNKNEDLVHATNMSGILITLCREETLLPLSVTTRRPRKLMHMIVAKADRFHPELSRMVPVTMPSPTCHLLGTAFR